MKQFIGMLAFALFLSFGTATVFSQGQPAPPPAPTPTDPEKPKPPSGPKVFQTDPSGPTDEKKDDKGGK
jgi:hypothetical protein